MKTILITGATGFFGKNLLKVLLEVNSDYEIFCTYYGDKGYFNHKNKH